MLFSMKTLIWTISNDRQQLKQAIPMCVVCVNILESIGKHFDIVQNM